VRCGGNLSGGDSAAELSPWSGGADPIAVVVEEIPEVAEEVPVVEDLCGRGGLAAVLPVRTSSRRRRIYVHQVLPLSHFPPLSSRSLCFFLQVVVSTGGGAADA
jgi:hypothetical protein